MKKLLTILLLTSLNLHAACIIDKPCKASTSKGNSATFETKQLAEAWIADNEKLLRGKSHRNSFGIVEHWTKEVIEGAETRLVEIEDILTGESFTHLEYKVLQDYTVSYEDVTVQENEKKAKKAAKNLLREKIKTKDLTLPEINELLRD